MLELRLLQRDGGGRVLRLLDRGAGGVVLLVADVQADGEALLVGGPGLISQLQRDVINLFIKAKQRCYLGVPLCSPCTGASSCCTGRAR